MGHRQTIYVRSTVQLHVLLMSTLVVVVVVVVGCVGVVVVEMISATLRLQRRPDETREKYAKRRNWTAAIRLRQVGSWAEDWKKDAYGWHKHVERVWDFV